MHFRNTQMGQYNAGIPNQIVAIGEHFHSQVGDGKVRTTIYKVRWDDKKDDTWEPITHLQGYATMVKSFKESHVKDLEKLAADRQQDQDMSNHRCSITGGVDQRKTNSLHL